MEVDKYMTVVGNRLRYLRELLNLTQEEFAKKLQISSSSLKRYEGSNQSEARELPLDLALKIAVEYGISLDWLTGVSDNMYRNQTPSKLAEIFNSLTEDQKKELFSYAMYLKNKGENMNE